MSIESDLKRLADAAEGILAAMTGTEVKRRGPGRPPADTKLEAAPSGEASAAPAAAAPPAVSTTAAAPSTSAAVATPTPGAIDVQAVKDRTKAILKLGRKDELLALVKKHGGESASTIPEGNRAAFLADSEALLAVDLAA